MYLVQFLDHFRKLEHVQWLGQRIFPVRGTIPIFLEAISVQHYMYISEAIWVEYCRFRPGSFSGHNRISDNFSTFVIFP